MINLNLIVNKFISFLDKKFRIFFISNMTPQIQKVLSGLPSKPGVYRFYDLKNSLLYVGKAKNLKNRVRSYFQNRSRLLNSRGQRIGLMIDQIFRIDYTVVRNEKESLILEANLIHSLQPKYNVSLKDDKSYIYVRANLADEIPSFSFVRQKYDPKSVYFGPYTKRAGIEDALRTIRQILPFCQEKHFTGKPCFYTSIHLCEGICAGLEEKKDYLERFEQVMKILSGQTKQVEIFIQEKIQKAIKLENYALAGLWRDRLYTLQSVIVDQKVVLSDPKNIDLISLVLEEQDQGKILGSLFYQSIREGKVINVLNYLLNGSQDPWSEDIESTEDNPDQEIQIEEKNSKYEIEFMNKFILSFYFQLKDLPDDILAQVFWARGDVQEKYHFTSTEIEIINQLLPRQIKFKMV
jgi:excinuclease ABC subunit C